MTKGVIPPSPRDWHLFIPKSVTVLRQDGYRSADFYADLLAGATVAIVALPLAIAIAIASGATPGAGLITAVVAGFLISALGGSRFQIGGPTGAFIVIVYGVIESHGYDGLLIATFMAGVILVVAGLLRLGIWIKYIPEPVVTGFTAGIAVIIFTSQVRDLFGLRMENVPADFIPKIVAFWEARDTVNVSAVIVSAAALAIIVALTRLAPRFPGFLFAVAGASVIVALLDLPVETLGSRFGGVTATFPMPGLPDISTERLGALLPSAFTIAFLAGLESLLSAMVADGMTGRRHRSNCELVAQGVANMASALFGGLCATGAIARTATNIRSGARTPVAGMLHALFLLAFMLGLGGILNYLPLAGLAAVLVVVAWNMSEHRRFRHLLSGPLGDRLILITTFMLTVVIDLTLAIEVGIVLAAVIFMHRMAETTAIEKGFPWAARDMDDFARPREAYSLRAELPRGVEFFELRGPLFFGAASRLNDLLEVTVPPPRAFILRLREVPLIDTTGASTLGRFLQVCAAHGADVVLMELQPGVRQVLKQMGLLASPGVYIAENYAAALAIAAKAAATTRKA